MGEEGVTQSACLLPDGSFPKLLMQVAGDWHSFPRRKVCFSPPPVQDGYPVWLLGSLVRIYEVRFFSPS